MIKLGTGNTTLYLGDKKVKAAWLGGKKVYPNSFLELSASSLSFAAAGASLPLVITVNDGQAWAIAALPAGFSVSASSGTGPATVTVTAANNTSETTRTGNLTVISEELTDSCSLLQTAGTKVYGTWKNISWSIDTTSFTAAGGKSNAVMNVARTWTWNGVAGSGGTETSTSSLRNATSSPTGISISSENWIQVPSLGTTIKAQTAYTLSSASAAATNQVSTTIVQAANAVTGYGTPTGRTLSVGDIPASGGTISSGTLGGTITQSRTFTSGASDTLTNPTVSSSSYSTAISGSNLGSTVTSRTAKGTLTHYYTCNGKQGSCSATVYQAANTWYDHDIVLSANSTSIGAGGGSVTLTSTVYRMYASGTRAVGGSGYGTLSGSASGFTVSGWTVSAASRGTTEGGARSISVTSKYAGLTSNAVTITQAANSVAGYTLSRLTANGSTIPYGGGTLAVTVRTYAYPRYSSGSTGTTDTLADVGQPSDTIGISWLSRLNVSKSGTGTYAFSYSAPQNSGTGDRTGTLTFSLSGKSTSLTVRQSGIPTYSLRIGAMTQAAWNAVMILRGMNLAYNSATPVSGSAGTIKLISLPSGVGETTMVSWQGEGLQYFNLTTNMGGPAALVIKVMPSSQSGKILSGATTQRGARVNLQGQVDANTTIVLGIYVEGE